MSKYTRLFIISSLIYLLLGVTVGLMGAFSLMKYKDMVFMHTHYNLLGFMVMMIIGVGYHIIPRFSGNSLSFAKLIPIQFWASHIGVILLTSGFHLKGKMPEYGGLVFIIGALFAYFSIAFFVLNIIFTMLKKRKT